MPLVAQSGPQRFAARRMQLLSERVDMSANYTAVVQKHGDWWIGWVEEVPGVNSQGETLTNFWRTCATH